MLWGAVSYNGYGLQVNLHVFAIHVTHQGHILRSRPQVSPLGHRMPCRNLKAAILSQSHLGRPVCPEEQTGAALPH